MNDDELDLWLSTHNEQFDARINERVDVERRREQVRSATEPEMATKRPVSIRSRKRLSSRRGPSNRYKRRSADASRSVAVILAVLCLLVFSAVVGDFANQWGTSPILRERGKTVIIGVPTSTDGLGMMQETHRYGFAYDLANWLAEDLRYSPRTFYSFSDFDGYPGDHEEMLRGGVVDMFITPNATTGRGGTNVSFAGPILVTRGGVLVRADDTAIRTIEDLAGKRVCTWEESTYKERLGSSAPVEKDVLSSCVDALAAGSVDAVAGDQILLSEIAGTEDAKELSVVPGLTFGSQQSYGIELEHDVSECDEVRGAISRFIASGAWDAAFRANMPGVPPAAFKPDPDQLDQCE